MVRLDPFDREFGLESPKLRIARHNASSMPHRSSSSETVGVSNRQLCFQFGGDENQMKVNGYALHRKQKPRRENLVSRSFPLRSQQHVIYFAYIDLAHQQLQITFGGPAEKLFNNFKAFFPSQET